MKLAEGFEKKERKKSTPWPANFQSEGKSSGPFASLLSRSSPAGIKPPKCRLIPKPLGTSIDGPLVGERERETVSFFVPTKCFKL